MYKILTNQSITAGSAYQGRVYTVEDAKITGVSDSPTGAAETIDLRALTVLPGLIDIHLHGGGGFDMMAGTYDAINSLSLYKIKEGVTAYCPSTVTASSDKTEAAISGVKQAITQGTKGAKVLGIFLEGPYIGTKFKGAHPEAFLRPIDLEEITALVKDIPGKTSVAIAQELPGAIEAIKALTAAGIKCRIGHADASYEQTKAAVDAGGNIAIHTYNAMSPLHHREPGMVGSVFALDDLYAEIICDLHHVHPAAIKALVNAKGPDKTVLITDCISSAGLPDGEYLLGELPIFMKDGVCRIAEGNLAGSTATLIGCLKNMHQVVGVPLVDAVTMATATPAKAIGVYDSIGSLDIGKQADIIAIDDDFNVRFVMVDGNVVLSAI